MTTPLHPLATTNLIRDSYLRYLKTIYPFQERDLRDQFWQALGQPDFVVKGPLLEASSPFKTGRSIGQLIKAGILHPDFRQLCSTYLPLDRPLYLHQDQAINKVVQDGRNLIVATGTGSGKTETFLIPILDHLLRERAAGTLEPGVRALLLYPMNALANDQLKRLRRILRDFPGITFGRYTGETEETDNEAEASFRQQFRDDPRLSNELISRRQLRAEPPHFLLTNYAMLEYLLLRPRDNAFFDGEQAGSWRFIVLDEAHVYDGAAGIEIAMLLRRLKDRVVGSERGRLRCLATSATLGSGIQDYPAVVQFARELLGEEFTWQADDPTRQDVVAATRLSPTALGATWGEVAPELYPELQQAIEAKATVSTLLNVARRHHAPAAIITEAERLATATPEAINGCLYGLLRGDARLRRLQMLLEEEAHLLSDLTSPIFPDHPQADERLINLINLAVRARPQPTDMSLLPARYHVFARALEGAFVCLNSAHHQAVAGDAPRLFLTRHEACPHCKSTVVELATCVRCGTTYIIGQLSDKARTGQIYLRHLTNHTEDRSGPKAYFVMSEAAIGLDEDEVVSAAESFEDVPDDRRDPYTLCLNCGVIEPEAEAALPCNCPADQRRMIYRVDLQKKTELTHCVSCGARSGSGIIFRFLTGQDAPVSVLATALYQALPPADDEAMDLLPGQGRKLLSFADSRQDAAFFAPYMERTYEQLLRRRLILKALIEDPDGRNGLLRLQDLIGRLLKQAEAAGQFTQRQSYDERRRLMTTWLMQELIAWDRRISLEGLGLLHFRLIRPDGWRPPQPLLEAPWNLSTDEAWQLLVLLLDTLRQQGAVVFPDGVEPKDEVFAPRNRALYFRDGQVDAAQGIFGWLPTKGNNRRLEILTKLLAETSAVPEQDRSGVARETLTKIWEYLTLPNSVWRDHLPAETLRRGGAVHRLSYQFWELVPVAETETAGYRCNRCRNISYINIKDICPSYGCSGELEPLNVDSPGMVENHYRYLYQHMAPIPFSAQEHTAQWARNEATRVQEAFVRGELNALSCSTTFELGVDVGELQAVLMRNVPPTTANYLQRAGRAGRRTDSAALALTYAQRRSHDLSHYADPKRIVAGQIRPPSVIISNEKIVRRHMHSVLFAALFRHAIESYGLDYRNVGAFFEAQGDQPSGPELMRTYVASRPAEVADALRRIVPEDLHNELALTSWGWLDHLWRDDEPGAEDPIPIFDIAAKEVEEDLALLHQMEDEAIKDRHYGLAQHFSRVAKTFRGRDLLGFLGSRNVLPKYGFPTDVVELRTTYLQIPEAQQVELQRDLRIAIAEYAPGGEVVAAKRIWTSGGIYKRPERDWPKYQYAICPDCNRFYRSLQPLANTCETCGSKLRGWGQRYGTYIVPEFGFIVSPEEPRKSGENRPQRLYASRVYFADYATPYHQNGQSEAELQADEALTTASVQVWKRYSRYGQLALVNSGPNQSGFRVCESCGYAEPAAEMQNTRRPRKPQPHKNPRTHKDCKGFIQTYHLGHDFITDVLELQFRGRSVTNPDFNLWWSVLYALLEGASEALGIRRDDLDGTLYLKSGNSFPSLVLFDNVPGGAGHVRRIAEELVMTFQAAWRRVERPCCGEETSCYECLRNFRNQPFHDQLQRGLARDFLKQTLRAAGIINEKEG